MTHESLNRNRRRRVLYRRNALSDQFGRSDACEVTIQTSIIFIRHSRSVLEPNRARKVPCTPARPVRGSLSDIPAALTYRRRLAKDRVSRRPLQYRRNAGARSHRMALRRGRFAGVGSCPGQTQARPRVPFPSRHRLRSTRASGLARSEAWSPPRLFRAA